VSATPKYILEVMVVDEVRLVEEGCGSGYDDDGFSAPYGERDFIENRYAEKAKVDN
jgi:hypothetical protein